MIALGQRRVSRQCLIARPTPGIDDDLVVDQHTRTIVSSD